jgi:hypothetical protein
MKVSLCRVRVLSWKETDDDVLIESSMKMKERYLLRVSFQTISFHSQFENLLEEYAAILHQPQNKNEI